MTGNESRCDSLAVSRPDEDFHVYSTDLDGDRNGEVSVDGQRYFTFAKEAGGDAVWPSG